MNKEYALLLTEDEIDVLEDICLAYQETMGSSIPWDTRSLVEKVLQFSLYFGTQELA